MIDIKCPQCGEPYQAPDGAVGQATQCPKCGATVHIAAAAAREPARPAGDGEAAPVSASPMDALTSAVAGWREPEAAPEAPARSEPPPVEPPPPAEDGVPVATPAQPERGRVWWMVGIGAVVAIGLVASIVVLSGETEHGTAVRVFEEREQKVRELYQSVSDRMETRGSLKGRELVALCEAARQLVAQYDELLTDDDSQVLDDADLQDLVKYCRMRHSAAKTFVEDVEWTLWPGPGGLDDMIPRMLTSVPVVTARRDDGEGKGSGFLIRRDDRLYVVTNRHVVEQARGGFELEFLQRRNDNIQTLTALEIDAEDLKLVHARSDLAVLDVNAHAGQLKKHGIRPLKLGKGYPALLSEIVVVGHPILDGTAYRLSSTDGKVTGPVRDEAGFGKVIQTSASMNKGNSGGPVFGTDGRVIGIATWAYRGTGVEGMNFAVHVDMLRLLFEAPGFRLGEHELRWLLEPARPMSADFAKVKKKLIAAGHFRRPMAFVLDRRKIYWPPAEEGQTAAEAKEVHCMVLGSARQAFAVKTRRGKSYTVLAAGQTVDQLKVIVVEGSEDRGQALEAEPVFEDDAMLVKFTAADTSTRIVLLVNGGNAPIATDLAVFEK